MAEPAESLLAAGNLCVVGNLNRDVKTAPLRPEPRLLEDGETGAAWIVETIGGGAANSASAAASLGARTALLAVFGLYASLGRRLWPPRSAVAATSKM